MPPGSTPLLFYEIDSSHLPRLLIKKITYHDFIITTLLLYGIAGLLLHINDGYDL